MIIWGIETVFFAGLTAWNIRRRNGLVWFSGVAMLLCLAQLVAHL